MAFKLAEAFVDIKANMAGLRASMNKAKALVTRSVSEMKRSLGVFARRAAVTGVAAGAGIALIGKKMVELAINAEESENLFEVSMAGMSKSARRWSNTISAALGLNQFELRKQVGTFNVMLKSMGLAEDQAFDMAKGLTVLTADMASFFNLEPEEAFQKLAAGISGESEPLKRLGILINEASTNQTALNKGIIQQGEKLTETQKIYARYLTIMDRTSNAQGDLARTLDSPANKLRILKSRIEEMGVTLGRDLIPGLIEWVDLIRNNLSKAPGVFDTIRTSLASAGRQAIEFGGAILKVFGIDDPLASAKKAFDGFLDFIANWKDTLHILLLKAWRVVIDILDDTVRAILRTLKAIPILGVGIPVEATAKRDGTEIPSGLGLVSGELSKEIAEKEAKRQGNRESLLNEQARATRRRRRLAGGGGGDTTLFDQIGAEAREQQRQRNIKQNNLNSARNRRARGSRKDLRFQTPQDIREETAQGAVSGIDPSSIPTGTNEMRRFIRDVIGFTKTPGDRESIRVFELILKELQDVKKNTKDTADNTVDSGSNTFD